MEVVDVAFILILILSAFCGMVVAAGLVHTLRTAIFNKPALRAKK